MQLVDLSKARKITNLSCKKAISPSVRRSKAIEQDDDSRQIVNNELKIKSDEAVFATFKQGNIRALAEIYDRYGLLVYRLIYKMLNNAQEAEDLTQEIFLSLQERPRFNPQRGSFYPYLIMLARSRTIDRLRSKRSQGNLLQNVRTMNDLLGKQKSFDLIEIVAIEERAVKVKQALETLSLNQRQILELAYYEGLSQSEIAKRLNIPLGTVKTHSRRGLLRLRKNLQNLVSEK